MTSLRVWERAGVVEEDAGRIRKDTRVVRAVDANQGSEDGSVTSISVCERRGAVRDDAGRDVRTPVGLWRCSVISPCAREERSCEG